jgi:PAS domain S-box-containing protein
VPSHPYTQLFDMSPFPAVVSGLDDQRVLACNISAAELVGVTTEDAIGQSVAAYYMDPAQRQELVDRVRRDGRADNVRLLIRRARGGPLWVLAAIRVIDWNGVAAALTVFHDISDQLAAESALRTNERRLAAQSDALTDLTARYTNPSEGFDERLRSILNISARALRVERLSLWMFAEGHQTIRCVGLFRVTGGHYEAGAVLHRRDTPEYFAAIEQERVVEAHDAQNDARTCGFTPGYLIPNGIGAMLDVPLRRDNTSVGVLCAEHVGGTRAWSVDEQNFAIAVGNLIVVAIVEDERREALARLAESEARARLIVDTAHDAFIGIDSDGNIAAWNAQAEATFGWTVAEVMGRSLAETIIPPGFREAHNAGLRRFHETGEAPVVNQRLELTALHRSGREFPIELTITSPIAASNGYFFAAFLRDISTRRERDAELRRARDAAEAATRAKSEFLANMSHELRTPLNGVLGYAQLLQRDRTMNATQREALEAIGRCGSQLLDLINDVLDLSKIEAGRLDIDEEPTDLARLMTDLKYVVAETADQKGLALSMTLGPGVPRAVMVDGRHLRQVLLNLLGNAVKFTTVGEVRLVISAADGRLAFDVLDTGPGIEPESLTTIFAAFAQTKAGAQAGGTGLGLTISDHLITRMGGTLSVESTLGQGSRFSFTLPLVEADLVTDHATDPSLPSLDAHLAPGVTLMALVVDDSTANRRILASLLESAGAQVIAATGGLEAIQLAHTHRPDVILMDLKMPDLDGLEATRRLVADPVTAAIPVIAVTASALGNARQAARAAGCVDYLSKPIRAQALFGVLQQHLGVRFISGTEAPPRPSAGLDAVQRTDVSTRLRTAVGLGDVTDIHALAEQLLRGSPDEKAVGERINRLVTEFDFAGLADLADSLTA